MAINPNAALQYIGARYVPKFYENPDTGDATWKSGVAYEGLMVVTYQQNSYTSKIPVPATVGNPASNNEYWVKTADWNAQLNALQQQVNTLNTTVAKIPKKRKYVLIGDSFSIGVVGGGAAQTTGWADYFHNCYPDDTFYISSDSEVQVSGVGAFRSGVFANIAQTIHDSLLGDTSPEEITDVVILGGTNENLDSTPAATCTQQIINIITNTIKPLLSTLYPNANVSIGLFCVNTRTLVGNGVYDGYNDGANAAGYHFISDLLNIGTNTDWRSSGGHLTPTGYNFCNPCVMNAILTGHCDYEWTEEIPLTLSNNVREVFGTTTYSMYMKVSNNRVQLKLIDKQRLRGWVLGIASDTTYSGAGTLNITAFTFTKGLFTQFVSNSPFATGHLSDSNNEWNNSLGINVRVPNTGVIDFVTVPRRTVSTPTSIEFYWDGMYNDVPIFDSRN